MMQKYGTGRMDSFTLTLVIVIFLCCLGLHFATALHPPVVIPSIPVFPVLPPASKMPKLPVMIMPIMQPIRPAVLRQNVAIARLMREELG